MGVRISCRYRVVGKLLGHYENHVLGDADRVGAGDGSHLVGVAGRGVVDCAGVGGRGHAVGDGDGPGSAGGESGQAAGDVVGSRLGRCTTEVGADIRHVQAGRHHIVDGHV